MTQSRARVPHRCHPFNDWIGDEFLAIDAADGSSPAFGIVPNVNVAMEMVDMLSASRAYEANLAVARNARQMAAKALTIGR